MRGYYLLLSNLLVSIAYFYFHHSYFFMTAATLQKSRMRKLPLIGTFFINYLIFYICSIQELNLIFNWVVFFLVLLGETILFSKREWRIPFYMAMSGILFGLSINILCRCVAAIMINQPLHVFDNTISSLSNLKQIPVFLGFLISGFIFRLLSKPKILRQLRILIHHPRHLSFQLELMMGMFLYLSLNLLLYHCQGNNLVLKLWGIKSCFFSLEGFYLGFRYSLKMCQLSDYRERNRTLQRELIRSEKKESELRTVAYRDTLTGAYNRQYAMKMLEELIKQHTAFTLCYLDLDKLKYVNDHLGHSEGDLYLTTVARELSSVCREKDDLLFRYGGDEFLLVFQGVSISTVEERMERVNQRLSELSNTDGYPYSMSLSYGTVESGDAQDVKVLLSMADKLMYARKQRMKKAR